MLKNIAKEQDMKRIEAKRMSTVDIVRCGLFTALIAVGAFIKIVLPVGPFMVTVSMQIFFSVLAGLLLGGGKGLLSGLVYLILGLVGLPIFAHGGGLGYLLRPTFGFLIGFAAAAWLSGTVAVRLRRLSWGRGLRGDVAAALCGVAAYFACGLAYYYIAFNFILPNTGGIGLRELFAVWLLSTIVPDNAIGLLAAVLASRLRPLLKARR